MCNDREEVAKIAMSLNGRHLIVGQGNIIMHYEWSFERNDADGNIIYYNIIYKYILSLILRTIDIVEFPDKYGKVVNVKFSSNKNDPQMFAITAINGIMFGILVINMNAA